MDIQKINLGTEPLGEGGDSYRTANEKINSNFEQVGEGIKDVSNNILETSTNLSEEVLRAKASESDLGDDITEEVLRAKASESDLSTSIAKEVSDRKLEVIRLDEADVLLQSQINEVGREIDKAIAGVNSLTINKGKLYPFTIQKRGDFAYDNSFISPIEAAILSIKVNNAHPDYYYRLRYVHLRESDLDNSGENNGWQFAKMLKTKWAEGERWSDMVTEPATTKHRLVANSGTNKFTIVATDSSDVSFDIVIDTDGLNTETTYALNASASNGFDHIIDPAFYKIKDYYKKSEVDNLLSIIDNDKWVDKLRSEYLLGEPSIVAESYGILPIDASGNADFDNPLFFRSANDASFPASLTKVLTALVALDSTLELTDMITITSEDSVGGSGNNLNIGDMVSFEDALYNMMLPSSNMTAMAVARTVGSLNGGNGISDFVDLMNAKAASLGMSNSHFVNPTGLSDNQQLTTLSDMFRLGYAAVSEPVLRVVWSSGSHDMNVVGTESRVVTVHTSFEEVRNNYWCLGGKTGTLGNYTNIMCHVALQNGYKGILVLLKSNGQQNRIDDALKVTNYVRNSYSYPAPSIITRN